MMNTSHWDGRSPRLRMTALALLAGLLATTACAPDPVGPELILAPNAARPSILVQNEDLVPYQDWSNPGSWGPGTGSLWTTVDEATPNDDTDYMWRDRFGLPPTNSVAILQLTAPVGGTPSPTQVHTLKVRWKVVGNYSTTTPQPTFLFYRLLEGANGPVIAAGSAVPSGSYATTSTVLLQSEVNSITDYNNLQLRLEAQLKPATQFDQLEARVTWARLEIR
jgi:hypothetical protein